MLPDRFKSSGWRYSFDEKRNRENATRLVKLLKYIFIELFSAQQEAIEQDDRYGDERFGCYFRVLYRGPSFSHNLANREFIIREPMASKLSEVSDRVRKSASALVGEDVELVMESVSPSDNTNSVQVTFLKVHRREWQTPFKNWQDFVNLTNFVYATPFTTSGDAHGDVKVPLTL